MSRTGVIGPRESSLTDRRSQRLRYASALLLCLGTMSAGCDKLFGKDKTVPSAAPTVTASASASVSAAPEAPPPPPAAPVGTGISSVVGFEQPTCKNQTADVGTYLQRGNITLAGVDGKVAVSFLIQLPGKLQIAFAGYDADAKQIARERSIATLVDAAPTLYPSKGTPIEAWYDADGLAYSRPEWEAHPKIDILHLQTLKGVPPEDVSIIPSKDGSLYFASTFGSAGDQLSVFKFAAAMDNPTDRPEAVGLTKHATKPRRPELAIGEDGYALVWVEQDGHVESSRLDSAGKDAGGSRLLLGPPAGGDAARSDLSLTAADGGYILTYTEGGQVIALALTKDVVAAGPPVVLGKGHWPVVANAAEGVYVIYVGEADAKPDQLVLLKLVKGQIAGAGLRVNDTGVFVKDPPALVSLGARVAVAWTEVMGPTVSSKRGRLRTIESSCIP